MQVAVASAREASDEAARAVIGREDEVRAAQLELDEVERKRDAEKGERADDTPPCASGAQTAGGGALEAVPEGSGTSDLQEQINRAVAAALRPQEKELEDLRAERDREREQAELRVAEAESTKANLEREMVEVRKWALVESARMSKGEEAVPMAAIADNAAGADG